MYRMVGVLTVGLLTVAVAHAHFPFIVPDEKGESAKVVFSDTLDPDENVNIEKIANTKLTLRTVATGQDTPLDWKKGPSFYAVNLPGSGDRIIFGMTDYGVLQKGDAPPFKLVYFPKAVIGKANAQPIGDKQPLEVVAEGGSGKVRFRVLALGQPVPEAETTVLLPTGEKKAVKTDKDGYTPPFEGAGRYAVYTKLIEAKKGEHAGKKYDEIRNYATLVCNITK
ncbi:MAG: DUF4198 domain-containing protein [Gemmataceae bacterium]|nr:DUF4198 domain-containing protein [Gemmata sp.]MDW8197955.1 DUF4198 domain-containing protein [Gemmataceae bacterium]